MVNAHFELKMWVCVSDVFDVKTIVENMITSTTKKKKKKNRKPANGTIER